MLNALKSHLALGFFGVQHELFIFAIKLNLNAF